MTTENSFIRFTSAPESYDYAKTETVCVVGHTSKGMPIRKIKVTGEDFLPYQEGRYSSGLYLCLSLEQLQELGPSLFGEVDMALAEKPL